MESMKVMAAVSTGRSLTPFASSQVSRSSAIRQDLRKCTTCRLVTHTPSPKWKIMSGTFKRDGSKNLSMRRSGVRASSLEDEPLDSKANKAAKEVEKETYEVKEASEETANKELEKLKDITNQLLEQAEIARQKLTATAQETVNQQKDNIAYVAENGPDPVKEVAESALSAHYSETPKKGAKIHDFCLGIPYGASLVAGGLLWFIISGGTSAIRFGVLLGGLLLFLSVTSLKVWKKGESSVPYIQGQAAITAFIFVRYFRRYSVNKLFFPTGFTGLVSAGMLAFYVYVLTSGGNPPKKPTTEPAT